MIEWINSLSKFGITALSVASSLMLAFAGHYVKSLIANKDRTYERKIYLRVKYEKLGMEASALLGFCEKLLNSNKSEAMRMGPEQSYIVNELKIYSLIYFPNLKDEVNDLVIESMNFMCSLLQETKLEIE